MINWDFVNAVQIFKNMRNRATRIGNPRLIVGLGRFGGDIANATQFNQFVTSRISTVLDQLIEQIDTRRAGNVNVVG